MKSVPKVNTLKNFTKLGIIFTQIQILICLLWIIASPAALATPSPIVTSWWRSSQTFFGEVNTNTIHSYWTNEYKTAEILLGYGNIHVWQLGLSLSYNDIGNKRDAWTFKYDYILGDQNSLSLKYVHQNWYWLEAGKESIGLAFTSSTNVGFFYAIGYYMRWLKQQWDPKPNSSFNFETEDVEGFIIASFGWRYQTSSGNYWTFDFNNNDNFSYYSSDNWATDFTYAIPAANCLITMNAGIRWTGILALAPYPATGYIGFGLGF